MNDLPQSEGTQRTGIGESLPGAPPAIGASAPADPPREPRRRRSITAEQMDAAAAALSRLADTRGDRAEAAAALQAMNHGSSFAASTAGMQLNVLVPSAPLASDEALRRFAAEWSEMARRTRALEPDPSGVLALAAREGFTVLPGGTP